MGYNNKVFHVSRLVFSACIFLMRRLSVGQAERPVGICCPQGVSKDFLWDGDGKMDNLGLSITVLITGMVVVFIMLILLIWIIKIYSTIVHKATGKGKGSSAKGENVKKKEEKPQQAQPMKAAKLPVAQPAPAVEQGIPGEVVAAIAAAVAVMGASSGARYSLRSVKRSVSSRPVWSTAGLMENTRPF